MIIEKLKRLWYESLTNKIYRKIRGIPIIRLFFDFEYTAELWRKSFFNSKITKVAEKSGIYKVGKIKIEEKYLPYLMCCCVSSLFFQELAIIPLTFITAALAVPYVKNRNFPLILLISLISAVIFAVFVPFSVFFYIIYVETGIILFFIIKYSFWDTCEKFIKLFSLVWVIGAVFGILRNTAQLTAVCLPYALRVFKRDGFRKYIYASILLGIGFYILSQEGRGGIAGGSAGIAFMILSGEWWLLLPVILTAPAVIGFTMDILDENIIRTGFFLWRHGFNGAAVDYDAVNMTGESLKIISYILSPVIFLFFWYVLRISRSAIIKLFKKDTKDSKFLKCGLASVLGFSIYTFFAYNGNSDINIILYLVSAALLRRMGGAKEG